MIRVAIINESTVLKDTDVQAVVLALQKQITEDFTPAWDIEARVNFYPSRVVPQFDWQLVLLDDSDQADALGYHELTPEGQPLGKVFAKSDILAGMAWTVTLSHEVLEMLADPFCAECVQNDLPNGSIAFFAKEICDAVEADRLGYDVDGITLSDFVLPQWFAPGAAGELDFCAKTSQAFEIAQGGYISVLTVSSKGCSGWQQITAEKKPGGPDSPRGSRRWRRLLPDAMWRRSRRA